MKELLDKYVETYETKDFIKNDPIQFPHRYKDKKDIEIAGFLASCFSFGRRKTFIDKLDVLFNAMDNKPYEFVMNYEEKNPCLDRFFYRFIAPEHTKRLVLGLKRLYGSNYDLERLARSGVSKFYNFFVGPYEKNPLMANPRMTSSLKRHCMFLRWMVRDGEVDLGIWKSFKKSELIIPVDVHCGRITRILDLVERRQNDFKMACELTDNLKKFDSNDPTKYDFALFGLGVTGDYINLFKKTHKV